MKSTLKQLGYIAFIGLYACTLGKLVGNTPTTQIGW
jgi:hypothetical protein